MKLKMRYVPSSYSPNQAKYCAKGKAPRCELTVYCQFNEKIVDIRKKCWKCENFIKQNHDSIECSFKGNSNYMEEKEHKYIVLQGNIE